jgi:hypothetical protein
MRRIYIAAIIIAAALVSSLAAPAATSIIYYYTDFEELPRVMALLGGWCEQYNGAVTCSDDDTGLGFASYYLYFVDLSYIDRMWINSKVWLPEAPNTSVNYGIALIDDAMDKAYIAIIDSYTGWVHIISYNVDAPNGWQDISLYLTGRNAIPNYSPTEQYIISLVYMVTFDAVHMYFQVNDTNNNILAEAWASSYFYDGAFRPSYIGLVVDEGNATFDYLLAAAAPTAFPVTSTVTETITETVTNTETVTATETITSTFTTTSTVTNTETVTATETITSTFTTTSTVTNTETVTATETITSTFTTTSTVTNTETVTSAVTTTVPSTVTITETVASGAPSTETVTSTVTSAVTYAVTSTETVASTVTSPVYVHLYRTATETVTTTVAGLPAVPVEYGLAVLVAMLAVIGIAMYILLRRARH